MLANGLAHRELPRAPNNHQIVDPLDDDQLAALGPDDPIYTPEPRHRALHATPYILLHMALLVVLFLLTVLVSLSALCGGGTCSLNSRSVQMLMHVAAWIVSAVLHHVLHQLHCDSYVKGYAQMYRDTTLYRNIPFLVYSVGNAILLIISVTVDEVGDSPMNVFLVQAVSLHPVYFVPILVALEMGLLFPLMCRYLLLIRAFNASCSPPDVARNDLQLGGVAAAAAPSGGQRDTCGQQLRFARELLRRQADALCSLRSHNSRLAHLAHAQHERLQQLEPAAESDDHRVLINH